MFHFVPFHFRVLHESLYGLHTSERTQITYTANGLSPSENNHVETVTQTLDADLAIALRLSEQEQRLLQEQMQREQEMLEEVLRLSLEEK